MSQRLFVTTVDGSNGHQGFVTEILKELMTAGNQYDLAIAVGPLIMMKEVSKLTKDYGLKTIVSMNPVMIDGTGMCGGCRISVGGRTKFACIDGPEFDGHEVDFDEAMRRQSFYKTEQKLSVEKSSMQAGGYNQCLICRTKKSGCWNRQPRSAIKIF